MTTVYIIGVCKYDASFQNNMISILERKQIACFCWNFENDSKIQFHKQLMFNGFNALIKFQYDSDLRKINATFSDLKWKQIFSLLISFWQAG